MPNPFRPTTHAPAHCGRALGLLVMLAALLLGLSAGQARADEIVRGEFTISNVTVRGIEDGKLVYRAGAGDNSVALEEIVLLNLENEPRLAEAMAAFNEDRMRSAETALASVFNESQVPWVKQFTGFYLARAYDARNKPVEAAQVYVYLASSEADPYLLSQPPLASLAQANDAQKTRVSDEITAIINDTEGPAREQLTRYLRLVVGDAQMPQIEPGQGDLQAAARAESKVILPDRIWKLVETAPARNAADADKWDAVKLLSEGKYQEAVDAITPWLAGNLNVPEMLYVLGRAQLGLADAGDDKDLYLDAGLTFMRLVVHYGPANGQSHALVVPGRLEVAYIHQKIGREDLFEELMHGNNGVFVVVDDPKAYPEYRKRYYQILGEEPPAVEQQQP